MSLTTYHKITREQFALNKQPQVILLTFEKFIRAYLFQKLIALGNNCQGKKSQNKSNYIFVQTKIISQFPFNKHNNSVFSMKITYEPFRRCRSRFSDFFIPLKLNLATGFITPNLANRHVNLIRSSWKVMNIWTQNLLIFTKKCTWGNACLLA